MKSKGRLKVLTFAIAFLLLGSAVVMSAVRTNPQARAAGAVITGLHVVGNQLENGNNISIVPHGVNHMGGEYSCISSGGHTFDGPVDQTAISAMLTWGITIVRVPLNEDCWLGINGQPSDGTTAAQYQQDVINYVNLLNANGIIAILDLHWTAPGTQIASGQLQMPDADHAPAFWTSMADTFKSNTSVLFDLYNEPFTTSWSCWLNGSTVAQASPCTDVGFAVAGMQTLVNAVRATGATTPLMLGGLAYSNDLSQWLQYKPNDPDNNLIASTHIYNFNVCNNTNCWNSQIAAVAANVPVIAGEIGENDCAHGFIDGLMPWLDSHGIGYLAWTWNPYNCSTTPSLITDYTGTPTAYGVGFKNHLLSLVGSNPTPVPTTPPTATPGTTPTVTPSPTPTYTPTPTVTPSPTPVYTPTPTPTPAPGSGCKVSYSVNQWPGGFTANMTLTNTGSTTINGWTLVFTFPTSQQVTQGWNGIFTQQGSNVTIVSQSYNPTIAPGASLNPGFNGSWSGSNPSPTSFTLNGVTCSIA
jgi:hypothetical protein